MAWVAAPAWGQAVTVATVGDTLHVRAPGFAFIEGPVLKRLQDGRSVRIDIDLAVLASPGGRPVTRVQQGFNVSFDLWEQRFAVTRIGTPARSISHLTSANAQAWCLENVTVPVSTLGSLGRETPFWVKLTYRVPDDNAEANDAPVTLWSLIEVLSRRQQDDNPERSFEAGPFRLAK
jgi:hypothetical protein